MEGSTGNRMDLIALTAQQLFPGGKNSMAYCDAAETESTEHARLAKWARGLSGLVIGHSDGLRTLA